MGSRETSIATVELTNDGLLLYRYKTGSFVTEERATELLERAFELTNTPRPTLIDISGVRKVTREARAVFAESELNRQLSSHAAFVVGSAVSRVIGNFFLGINKPDFPTRLFSSEDEALEWLRIHG